MAALTGNSDTDPRSMLPSVEFVQRIAQCDPETRQRVFDIIVPHLLRFLMLGLAGSSTLIQPLTLLFLSSLSISGFILLSAMLSCPLLLSAMGTRLSCALLDFRGAIRSIEECRAVKAEYVKLNNNSMQSRTFADKKADDFPTTEEGIEVLMKELFAAITDFSSVVEGKKKRDSRGSKVEYSDSAQIKRVKELEDWEVEMLSWEVLLPIPVRDQGSPGRECQHRPWCNRSSWKYDKYDSFMERFEVVKENCRTENTTRPTGSIKDQIRKRHTMESTQSNDAKSPPANQGPEARLALSSPANDSSEAEGADSSRESAAAPRKKQIKRETKPLPAKALSLPLTPSPPLRLVTQTLADRARLPLRPGGPAAPTLHPLRLSIRDEMTAAGLGEGAYRYPWPNNASHGAQMVMGEQREPHNQHDVWQPDAVNTQSLADFGDMFAAFDANSTP
ncbi:hypothetical protein B0H63DRAFT_537418 [Podospora didyma]|uniref:Uncharacterized protein n=1 Tax=Podospora didyma TaxID=330526 RepID=A0AAE0NXP2_9PEZI|nr:hypothetical protein B0H63DRAFT_537418 [Podospora didyma]